MAVPPSIESMEIEKEKKKALEKYIKLEKLGEGTYGVVFKVFLFFFLVFSFVFLVSYFFLGKTSRQR